MQQKVREVSPKSTSAAHHARGLSSSSSEPLPEHISITCGNERFHGGSFTLVCHQRTDHDGCFISSQPHGHEQLLTTQQTHCFMSMLFFFFFFVVHSRLCDCPSTGCGYPKQKHQRSVLSCRDVESLELLTEERLELRELPCANGLADLLEELQRNTVRIPLFIPEKISPHQTTMNGKYQATDH